MVSARTTRSILRRNCVPTKTKQWVAVGERRGEGDSNLRPTHYEGHPGALQPAQNTLLFSALHSVVLSSHDLSKTLCGLRADRCPTTVVGWQMAAPADCGILASKGRRRVVPRRRGPITLVERRGLRASLLPGVVPTTVAQVDTADERQSEG